MSCPPTLVTSPSARALGGTTSPASVNAERRHSSLRAIATRRGTRRVTWGYMAVLLISSNAAMEDRCTVLCVASGGALTRVPNLFGCVFGEWFPGSGSQRRCSRKKRVASGSSQEGEETTGRGTARADGPVGGSPHRAPGPSYYLGTFEALRQLTR